MTVFICGMKRALTCTACLLPIMSLNAFVIHSFKLPRVTSSLNESPSSSSSSSTFDLVVIGGGSAGLTAAKFAANFGKTVCLIESSKIGGDCTWTGCLPSKTLLSAAKRAWTWRQMNEKFGDPGTINDDSFRKMLRNVKIDVDASRNRIYEEDDSPKVLKSLGIDIANGRAFFQDAHSVNVKNEVDGTNTKINAKFGIVIATGAAPGKTMFDVAGLDSIPYWTYENIWDEGGFFDAIDKNQKKQVSQMRVIVVGGGPIGCELSQAISRLGCSVVLISRSNRLLPLGENEASDELQRVFAKEGLNVICNQRVLSVTPKDGDDKSIMVTLDSHEPIVGDHILIATGRVPNVKNMGLDEIGVKLNRASNGIQVDDKLQTSIKGIFAAGDCTGDRQFTHYAGYQGAIAARNILLPLKDLGVLSEVPSTTFTDPEIASFGLTEQAAIEKYGASAVSVSFRQLGKVDRAVCEGNDANGFIKILYKTKTKQILGATIMCPSGGEMIAELSVAQETLLPFDKLATVMHSYPTYSIALQQMAAQVYYDKLKKSKALYDLLKKIGL